jgi:hypothetical protein
MVIAVPFATVIQGNEEKVGTVEVFDYGRGWPGWVSAGL